MCNYWLLGADWSGEDKKKQFFSRGYWKMGYTDEDKPSLARKRDRIVRGDRVAIKRRTGDASKPIIIQALGFVKDVEEGRVYIDWLLTDLEREVPSKSLFGHLRSGEIVDEMLAYEAKSAGIARL